MPNSDCPQCHGSGWIIAERSGITGAKRCECILAEQQQENWDNAGIPPLYENASLDNFVLPTDNQVAARNLQNVMLIVRGYAKEFPAVDKPGLLLIGEPGTGKTHLAVAALRTLIGRGFSGVFYDYQHLLQSIRASYDPTSGSTDREAYATALDAELLLLDDLGAHRITDWVEDTVTSLITYRCNNRKPIIATTNLSDPDIAGASRAATTGSGREYGRTLADQIGMRARSRLFEMCRVIRMPQVEDYRFRKARIS
jgi:DNA replication protein DnaC